MTYNFGSKLTNELLIYASDPIAYDKDVIPLLGDMIVSSSIKTLNMMMKQFAVTFRGNREETFGNLKTAVSSGDKAQINTALRTLNSEHHGRMLSIMLNVSVATTVLPQPNQAAPTQIERPASESQ
jgi:tetrahydrodipicolinate N-succinyltransferase